MQGVRNTLGIPLGVCIILASYFLGMYIADKLWFMHLAVRVILSVGAAFLAANLGLFSVYELWDRWSGHAFDEEEYDEENR